MTTLTLDPWALHTGGFSPQRGLEPVVLHGAPVVALVFVSIGDGVTVGSFFSARTVGGFVTVSGYGSVTGQHYHAITERGAYAPDTGLSGTDVIRIGGSDVEQ